MCLKHTKHQHHFVLFVRMVVEIYVLCHLIFSRNSDVLIREIDMLASKYQLVFVENFNDVTNCFET